MRLSRRRERDRQRKEKIRQDQLMIAYIKVKYPVIHEEANQYYSTINAIYKNKKDLRKTDLFREAVTTYRDNMVLEIPLIQTKKPEEGETVNQDITTAESLPDITTAETLPDIATGEMSEERMNQEVIDNILPDMMMPTLEQELPEGLIQQIISELRADPELANLMNDIEDKVDDDLDIDIDDNLLDKELL